MSIKSVHLLPDAAPYPFYRPESPSMQPLLKPAAPIVTFDPAQDYWFWETCCHSSEVPAHVFQADWPEGLTPAEKTTADLVAKVAWDLFCLVIFPLALIRLVSSFLFFVTGIGVQPPPCIKGISETALQKLKDRHIYNDQPLFVDKGTKKILLKGLGAERTPFAAPDGVLLEGAFIPGTLYPNKVIFYVTGSGGGVATSLHKLDFLSQSGVSIFTISPRGVEESKGSPSPRGMALDVFAAYEYLIKQRGFNPNDILGYFFSLGGLHGNMGAALIQEKYPDAQIKAIDERSPSDLVAAAPISIASVVGNGLLNAFGNACIQAFWQMDGTTAFQRLKGDRCIIHHASDATIPYSCSKYKAITERSYPFGQVRCLEMTPSLAPLPGAPLPSDPRLADPRLADPQLADKGGRNQKEHLRFFNGVEAAWVVNQIDALLGLNMDLNTRIKMILRETFLNTTFG